MGLSLWFWTLLTGSRFKGLLLEGRRMLKSEQLTSALRCFREVSERWPERVEGFQGMEQVYRAMGLAEEAQREANIARAMLALMDNPSDLPARLRLIKELVAKQMYATALPHMEQALKLGPSDQEVLRQAGVVLRYNHLFDRALEAANKALSKEPLAPDLYEQQAFSLRALNRQLEATQAVNLAKALQAVAREPTNPEVMERAIIHLSAVKRRRQGLTLVERSLADYPQAAALHCIRAELLLEQDRHQEALANLREALALEPTRAKPHAVLAVLFQQVGEAKRADHHRELAQMLEQARRAPDRVDSETMMVEALLRLKHVEQAQERAEALCRKYPQDWRCHTTMGKVRKAQGNLPQALACYRQAVKLDDKVPAIYMDMAWLHAQAGQVKDAVYQARQAVGLVSRDPGLRQQMADLLDHLGFSELAKEERELAEAMIKAAAARAMD